MEPLEDCIYAAFALLVLGAALTMLKGLFNPDDEEERKFWLTTPYLYIGVFVLLRICLGGSELNHQPPVVAATIIVFIGLSTWLWTGWRWRTNCSTWDDAKHYITMRNSHCLSQVIWLPCSFGPLVTFSVVSCWVWLSFAAFFTVVFIYTFAWSLWMFATRKEQAAVEVIPAPGMESIWMKTGQNAQEEKVHRDSVQKLIIIYLVWFCIVMYSAICIQRNAITHFHGVAEPGAVWEKYAYDANVKIEVERYIPNESLALDGIDAPTKAQVFDALIHVTGRGRFWERTRELRIKSFTAGKRTYRVEEQDDVIEPKEGETRTIITTTKGVQFWARLTDEEEKRFQK